MFHRFDTPKLRNGDITRNFKVRETQTKMIFIVVWFNVVQIIILRLFAETWMSCYLGSVLRSVLWGLECKSLTFRGFRSCKLGFQLDTKEANLFADVMDKGFKWLRFEVWRYLNLVIMSVVYYT